MRLLTAFVWMKKMIEPCGAEIKHDFINERGPTSNPSLVYFFFILFNTILNCSKFFKHVLI